MTSGDVSCTFLIVQDLTSLQLFVNLCCANLWLVCSKIVSDSCWIFAWWCRVLLNASLVQVNSQSPAEGLKFSLRRSQTL